MRRTLSVVLLCLILVACAGFQYTYYGLAPKSYDGTLLGPNPKQDVPFATCSPTPTDVGKCIVMTREEFFKLRLDYSDLQTKLKACQSGNP